MKVFTLNNDNNENSNLGMKLNATTHGHASVADSISSYGGNNKITITWSTSGKIQFRVDGTLVKEI